MTRNPILWTIAAVIVLAALARWGRVRTQAMYDEAMTDPRYAPNGRVYVNRLGNAAADDVRADALTAHPSNTRPHALSPAGYARLSAAECADVDAWLAGHGHDKWTVLAVRYWPETKAARIDSVDRRDVVWCLTPPPHVERWS